MAIAGRSTTSRWKLNLLVRRDNLAAETFYERLGFERAETVQWQRWIGPGRG